MHLFTNNEVLRLASKSVVKFHNSPYQLTSDKDIF